MNWGALDEVTNIPSTAPQKQSVLRLKVQEKEKDRDKWWSIGRGRKDSKEKEKERSRRNSRHVRNVSYFLLPFIF
jgi:serine/arginine repetitive matrix protein 2